LLPSPWGEGLGMRVFYLIPPGYLVESGELMGSIDIYEGELK
jgi:hypothetical protein